MTHDPDLDFEPPHASSPTAHIVDQIELYGFTPSDDEPDPREPADDSRITEVMHGTFDSIAAALRGTRSEPDGSDLLWGLVNACHRAAERVGRILDDNEVAQRDSQREQDGSEVKSVELERLLGKGQVLLDRRDALEAFRDAAADGYRRITGEAWTPRHGSKVNHRAMTASMIDSREFIAAKRRAETQVLLPPGAKIAFTGGTDCNDHRAIWAALDRVHAKHADMVLLHGGSPKGAELIAAKWADARKVTHIAFKPDWDRHKRAAPFKRNDAMLETLPIGLVIFPGTGISDNLAEGQEAWHPAVRLPQGRRMSAGPTLLTIRSLDMSADDLAYEAQQIAMHDTIAWDEIYVRATAQAQSTGFAQLILERRPADYELVDGSDPTALRVDRLAGAKIHVILDWP